MQPHQEAPTLNPATKPMSPLFRADVVKGMYRVLAEEIGPTDAKMALVESFMWDTIFDRPKWHPERFWLRDERDEEHYKRLFDDLVPFICLFNRLKDEFDDDRAQSLTAKVAVPAGIPYLAKSFTHIENVSNVDQLRQKMPSCLGDGNAFEWREEFSDDPSEVRFRLTRCIYIEILRAYGLFYAAMVSCYCDHIIFDNALPKFDFSRDTCKGVGDAYCSYRFKVKSPEDDSRTEDRCGDATKAPLDARKIMDHWRVNFEKNGKFDWS